MLQPTEVGTDGNEFPAQAAASVTIPRAITIISYRLDTLSELCERTHSRLCTTESAERE